MTFAFPLVGLVTLLSIIVFHWTALNEAKARQKNECPPPANTGPDEFMRYQRVRGNTMEALLIFLPSIWLFAICWGDSLAALIGVVFPIARVIYALGYYKAADKRSMGFLIGWIASIILLLGAFVGLAMQALGL